MPSCPCCNVSCLGFVQLGESKSIKSQISTSYFGKSWSLTTPDDKRACPICLEDFDTIEESALVATVRQNNSFCHLFCHECLSNQRLKGELMPELNLKAPPPHAQSLIRGGFDSIALLSSQVSRLRPDVPSGEPLDIHPSFFLESMAEMLHLVRHERDSLPASVSHQFAVVARENETLKREMNSLKREMNILRQELSREKMEVNNLNILNRNLGSDLRKSNTELREYKAYMHERDAKILERDSIILDLHRKIDSMKTATESWKALATNQKVATGSPRRSTVFADGLKQPVRPAHQGGASIGPKRTSGQLSSDVQEATSKRCKLDPSGKQQKVNPAEHIVNCSRPAPPRAPPQAPPREPPRELPHARDTALRQLPASELRKLYAK